MALGATYSDWGERQGRRFFVALAVAGSFAALFLGLELAVFLWVVDSAALDRLRDLMRLGMAGALLSGGCALSPRFTWVCAGVVGLVLVTITAGLVLLFGSVGCSYGSGIAIFCSALGLVIHIIRFVDQGESARGSRFALCLAAGSFCLLGMDAWVRQQSTWWVNEPWIIVPALAPWVGGLALWVFNDGVRPVTDFREIKRSKRLFSLWFLPALQALILSIGWIVTNLIDKRATIYAIEHLQFFVKASSAWVNPDLFASQIDRGIGHDPGAEARLRDSLDAMRRSDPQIVGGILWRTYENKRFPVVESHSEEYSPYELDPIPSTLELRGILNQQPIAVAGG